MVQDDLPVGIQFGHFNPMNLGPVVPAPWHRPSPLRPTGASLLNGSVLHPAQRNCVLMHQIAPRNTSHPANTADIWLKNEALTTWRITLIFYETTAGFKKFINLVFLLFATVLELILTIKYQIVRF